MRKRQERDSEGYRTDEVKDLLFPKKSQVKDPSEYIQNW